MGIMVEHTSARNAHATSHSRARAPGHCPTGPTRAKRQPDCAVFGPRPPHRASIAAAPAHARPKRPRRFVPQPALPALVPVPRLSRGGRTIAPRPSHLGRGLGARAVAPTLSCRPHPGRTHATAMVPACGADPGAQRPPLGAQFLLPRATAPRRLANGRCRPSRFAERHTGLLAAHRGRMQRRRPGDDGFPPWHIGTRYQPVECRPCCAGYFAAGDGPGACAWTTASRGARWWICPPS